MPNTASGGLSVYVTEGNNAGAIELGSIGSSYTVNTLALYVDWTNGISYFDCYGSVGGRVFGDNTLWNGFISGNRYARTASFIARGGSQSYGMQKLAEVSTASDQGLNTYQIYCMTAPLLAVPQAAYYSTKRISFAAIHEGYTPAQCRDFFELVHTMRQEIGGGYA